MQHFSSHFLGEKFIWEGRGGELFEGGGLIKFSCSKGGGLFEGSAYSRGALNRGNTVL